MSKRSSMVASVTLCGNAPLKQAAWVRWRVPACLLASLLGVPGLKAAAHGKPAAPPASSDARRVNFDLRTGHPFLGLATVIWPGAPFATQRHEVMGATKMSWVRIPLMNSFSEGDERPGMSVAQVMAQRPNHPVRAAAEKLSPQQVQGLRDADQRTGGRYRSLGDELRAANISFVIAALPNFPKSWMKTFEDKGAEYKVFMGGQSGQPDHRQDYITLVVAEILAARQAGLPVTGVEMPFEPDEPGGEVPPDVANSMVGKLRNTLNANGLAGVAIAAPGTGSTLNAARYISAMEGKGGHVDDVKYFSAHDYETAHFPVPVGLTSSLLGATRGLKPILVTEFNDSSSRWKMPPYVGSPRSSPPKEGLNPANASNHDEFAVSVVAEGLKLVSDGAAGICVWEMNDIYWKKTSYGMIDLLGKLRPTVAAFSSFMGQVGRGSDVMAYGTDAGPGLGAAAFRVTRNHQRGLVEVLANATNAPIRVRVSQQGQDATDDLGRSNFTVAATFPAVKSGPAVDGAATPTVVVPPNTILVLSNLPSP